MAEIPEEKTAVFPDPDDDFSDSYRIRRQIAHELHSPAMELLREDPDFLQESPGGSGSASGQPEKESPFPANPEQQWREAQKAAGKTDEEIEAMLSGAEEPWIDPVSAFTGGFAGTGTTALKAGMKLVPTLVRSLASGTAGAVMDFPIGMATEKVGEKFPALALPFNVLTGLVSGMTIENAIEKRVIQFFSKKGVKPSAALVEDTVNEVRSQLEEGRIDDDLSAAVARDLNDLAADSSPAAAKQLDSSATSLQDTSLDTPARPSPTTKATGDLDSDLERQLDSIIGDSSRPLVEIEKDITPEEAERFLTITLDSPDPSGKAVNINLANLSTEDDVKTILAKTGEFFRTGIDEARRGKISEEETERLADDMGMTVRQLLSRRKGQAFNAEEVTAARNILVASGERLAAMAKKVSSGLATDLDKFAFQKMLTVHYAIQAQVSGMAAEAGRALRAFGISAAEPAGRLKQIKEIMQNMSEGKSAEDLAVMISTVTEAGGNVNVFTRQAFKANGWDMLMEAWINGLLSGPVTHAVNVTSNTLFAMMQIPERLIAAGIGRILPGEAEIHASEAAAQAFGLLEGLKDGFKLAARALAKGESSDLMGKVDLPRRAITAENLKDTLMGKALKYLRSTELEQGGPVARAVDLLGEIVRAPGRALMSEDELFKSIGYRMELRARAFRQAASEGLKGKAMAARIQEILNDPPDDIHLAAIDAARYQTFTDKLGDPGRAFQSLIGKARPLRLVVPFFRVSANIMKRFYERTPVPALEALLRKNGFREDILAGGARRDLALARVSLGSMVMSVMGYMASQGIVTGGGPADPVLKRHLRSTGWQPYSFKVGDKYYSYNRLDPIGMIFGIAADTAEIIGQLGEEDAGTLALAATMAAVKNITSKTWFYSLSQVISALDEPERDALHTLEAYAKSLTPRIAAQAERVIDPTFRNAYDDRGHFYTLFNAFKSQVPGWSDSLPPARNIWAEPITPEGALGPDVISPVYQSTARSSPVDEELVRLRLPLPMPRKVQPIQSAPVRLTAEEYDRFLVLMNEVPLSRSGKPLKTTLDELVTRDPVYREASDEDKATMIRELLTEARARGRARLYEESADIQTLVDMWHEEQRATR